MSLDVNTLHKGDAVTYTADGQDLAVTVQDEPEEFGAYDSRSVTIGYGPGRWNRSVSNDGQKFGFYRLSRGSA